MWGNYLLCFFSEFLTLQSVLLASRDTTQQKKPCRHPLSWRSISHSTPSLLQTSLLFIAPFLRRMIWTLTENTDRCFPFWPYPWYPWDGAMVFVCSSSIQRPCKWYSLTWVLIIFCYSRTSYCRPLIELAGVSYPFYSSVCLRTTLESCSNIGFTCW